MNIDSDQKLYRFTQLPFLIDILGKSLLTLVDPKLWQDKNDAFLLGEFKRRKKLKSVLGLCFTSQEETSHHWDVYGNGPSGVCIEFDTNELLEVVQRNPGIKFGPVAYKTTSDMKSAKLDISEYPFTKQRAFSDEREYRLIAEDDEYELDYAQIAIKPACIKKITLSPWMPDIAANSVIKMIENIAKHECLEVNHSSLLDNEEWKSAIREENSNRGRTQIRIRLYR